MDIHTTLDAREKTHGSFHEHATVTQELKQVIDMWSHGLCYEHAEALDMILHKIGRIIAGDPYYKDHWHDIAGYAMLAERVENNANL